MGPIREHATVAVVLGVLLLGTLLAAVLALALGADLLSMVLGGAAAAAAIFGVVVVWGESGRREASRSARRAEREIRDQGSRTRRAVHAAERRLYSQLEAFAWLRDEIDLPLPLAPMRGAAASPDLLLELTLTIDRIRPEVIVELGSGISTVVMAARCKAAGRGRVVALEHDPGYAEATRAQLSAQGLAAVAEVVDAPLRDVVIGGKTWSWYALGDEVPDEIDLLLVDGPPSSTGPLARYPALVLLEERLAPGALVIADDGDRSDEREMVKRWQAEYPAIEVRYLPFAKGAWLLTMND